MVLQSAGRGPAQGQLELAADERQMRRKKAQRSFDRKLRHIERFALQQVPGPLVIALRQCHACLHPESEQRQPRGRTRKIQVWTKFEELLRRGLSLLQLIPLVQQSSITQMRLRQQQR